MCATTSKDDKFAFLFKTNAVTDYDLGNVKNTLKNYYGYQDANIKESTGCNNLTTDFATFATSVASHAPVGDIPSGTKKNTMVIFIVGNADSAGLSDGTNDLIWDDLVMALNPLPTNPYSNSEAHFYFIFPYCGTFYLNNMFPFPEGSVSLPITDNFNGFNGHASFLSTWVNTFGINAVTLIDSDRLLRFDVAADAIYDSYGTPPFPFSTYYIQRKNNTDETSAYSPFYPGYPAMGIDDGSPWYESPDIYINTIDNDLYTPGATETIHIIVHNTGTHFVTCFGIGAKHFGTGIGQTEAFSTGNPTYGTTPFTSVLLPEASYDYSYPQEFTLDTTHRCIRARVQLTPLALADFDESGEWSVIARANEAQRNIDPFVTAPAPAPPPAPEQAQEPDPDPEPDAEDTENTGDRSLKNLRGFKEHIYSIQNTFKQKRKFRLVLNKEFEKYSKIVNVKFLRLAEKKGEKSVPLKILNKPYPHIPFLLESGEIAEIVFYLAVKPKTVIEKEIRLPMEILVDITGRKVEKLRKSPFLKLDRNFAPVGGITVKVSTMAFSIQGRVLDKKEKPAAGARVFIRTVNGRQAAVLKTDKKGCYSMKGINPDSYRMYAAIKDLYSKDKIVNLFCRDLFVDFCLE